MRENRSFGGFNDPPGDIGCVESMIERSAEDLTANIEAVA
jgi:hypothetical protein